MNEMKLNELPERYKIRELFSYLPHEFDTEEAEREWTDILSAIVPWTRQFLHRLSNKTSNTEFALDWKQWEIIISDVCVGISRQSGRFILSKFALVFPQFQIDVFTQFLPHFHFDFDLSTVRTWALRILGFAIQMSFVGFLWTICGNISDTAGYTRNYFYAMVR